MIIKDIFSSRKIIPGFLKNFLGLQIIRLSISYLIIMISKSLLNSKKQNFFKKQLYNEGYFIKEFLKKDELKRLKDICDKEMIYSNSKKKGYMKELIVTKEILRKRDSKLNAKN